MARAKPGASRKVRRFAAQLAGPQEAAKKGHAQRESFPRRIKSPCFTGGPRRMDRPSVGEGLWVTSLPLSHPGRILYTHGAKSGKRSKPIGLERSPQVPNRHRNRHQTVVRLTVGLIVHRENSPIYIIIWTVSRKFRDLFSSGSRPGARKKRQPSFRWREGLR